MKTDQDNRLLSDIILPLLTERYLRLRENFSTVLTDLCVSDFSEDEYKYVFPNLIIKSVEPVNKLLTRAFFLKDFSKILPEIIGENI